MMTSCKKYTYHHNIGWFNPYGKKTPDHLIAQYIQEIEQQNTVLLEALKEVRRHGLIEKDGYTSVVTKVNEAIKKAES